MNTHDDLEQLRDIARDTKKRSHGARLRRALLVLAIPATAALTTACYGVPMSQPGYDVSYGEPLVIDGVDCDGDGTPDVLDVESCSVFVPTGK